MRLFLDIYSKECQSCKDGKWLGVFFPYMCQANCSFCTSPYKDDRIVNVFGSNKKTRLGYLKQNNFNGIGFSGGDPFVRFSRLLDWFYFFKTEISDFYFCVCTSGIAIIRKQIDINYYIIDIQE